MGETIDRQRAVDILFDTDNSEIISELEDGKKELSHLASKSTVPADEILSKLSYLIETGIIIKSVDGDSIYLAADHDRLSEIVESDGNFDAAIDGLAKMDSYLN